MSVESVRPHPYKTKYPRPEPGVLLFQQLVGVAVVVVPVVFLLAYFLDN
ncbi:Uncharacterised protein [Mycobacteroides abscessus subsp. abscessus]|nr:Uncharacterised protein [Mycobacteroides abscessus subsp. abscessus]SHY41725.1 Uncharacterised protein [Mycobacteroides abscessus subsp. abscessus]SIC44251.1 Uncharacterised protein [Mycobacteroides abscessus subsp. abscessus]SIE67085.1 Uncharacterised protein [Mycobacteroides abscessus subsp. abscessus]SIG40077.1 Uncharacterised protein [Mycobacteroides abscessus subsp. abscessus]